MSGVQAGCRVGSEVSGVQSKCLVEDELGWVGARILGLAVKIIVLQESMIAESTLSESAETRVVEHPPNNTLYVSNLNEKVPLDDLKDKLLDIFEEFGEVVDIVAKRNIRMRGQAFIIFKDLNSAIEARHKINGQELFKKTIRINFSRQKSDVIAKFEGTFASREKSDWQGKFQEKFVLRPKRLESEKKAEREKNQGRRFDRTNNIPHHTLFVQGITPKVSAEALASCFHRFPGLKDIRMAPKDYAFIEFTDEFKAGSALAEMNGFQIEDTTLQISYAKK